MWPEVSNWCDVQNMCSKLPLKHTSKFGHLVADYCIFIITLTLHFNSSTGSISTTKYSLPHKINNERCKSVWPQVQNEWYQQLQHDPLSVSFTSHTKKRSIWLLSSKFLLDLLSSHFPTIILNEFLVSPIWSTCLALHSPLNFITQLRVPEDLCISLRSLSYNALIKEFTFSVQSNWPILQL